MARHVRRTASRFGYSVLAGCRRIGRHRISRIHPSRFRCFAAVSEFESDVQPLGRRGIFRQTSEIAQSPARQGRASRRRPDDDRICRHARASPASRHPGLSGGPGRREWRRTRIVRPEERRIGFLGFGLMAKAPALVLKSLGFPVSAWVRNWREEGEIPIFYGAGQLEPFLNQTDIAVCLLPLTRETEGIFCDRTFAMMPQGAMLVNVGRGKHVVEEDLIAALDSGQLAYAALDALWPEPLPPQSPLWLHPKVTVMPHVARRPTVRQLATEIAANIRSLEASGRLLQEVDVTLGY